MARPERQWLVAVVGLGLDGGRRVIARCERQKIQAYFPQERYLEAVDGKTRRRIRPLFDGYAFVRHSAIRAVLDISGVYELLRTELGYSMMRNDDVSALRALEDRDGYIRLGENPSERFTENQPVKEAGSAFVSGLWRGLDTSGRHRVLYSVLGRFVEKLVDDEALFAA